MEVKNAFQGIASEQDTLVKYFEVHNEKFLQHVGVNRAEGTYKRFLTSLGHLKHFMRKKYNISDIPFQALTPSFVADYDYYLRIELGLACGTIINTIVHLRRIIKIAINNGLVRNDPFIDYKYIAQEPVPKSLTSDELDTLIKAELSRPNLNFIRDMFLFLSFTGIAFSDMRLLTKKNLSIYQCSIIPKCLQGSGRNIQQQAHILIIHPFTFLIAIQATKRFHTGSETFKF